MALIRIFKQTTQEDPAYTLLLEDLARTKQDLEQAYANFEHVVEPDLIDSCIYQLNAVQMKYKFLLGRAKQYEYTTKEKASLELVQI